MFHNTLCISRGEARAKAKQHGGYGQNFESAFITGSPQLPQAEGHHRVICYKLGSLDLIVRIEADGYYADGEESDESPNKFFRDVLGTITQRTIKHYSPRATVVLAQGTMVPYSKTLELKSSSSKCATLEQLWFGGSKGLIEAAEVIRLKQAEFEDWEIKNQKHLLRLA